MGEGREQREDVPAQPEDPIAGAIRALAETGAKVYEEQQLRHVRPETLMERIEREQRKRRPGITPWTFGVTIGFLLLLIPTTLFTGGCLLVPVGMTLLFGIVGYLTLRPADARRLARQFDGHVAQPGEVPRTQEAVGDMRLAFGLRSQPQLVVIEAPSVNAVASGRLDGVVAIGVTRALADAMSIDEQRAVIAQLLARLLIGSAAVNEGDPSLESQADSLALQTLRDARALLRALERASASDSSLAPKRGLAGDLYFFAPSFSSTVTGAIGAAQLEVRLKRLRAVCGAEGAQ
jgi:Zn-dependent protease with chaperone function